MVTLIQSLINRGHAYAIKGEILFDIASMQHYGKLSRRPLDGQQAGARIAVDAHKKNPGDFVLWKASSAEEPGWDAVFTVDALPLAIRGRPGWHIECSAMSAAYLGEVFDIHGGGLDLIFPHHENEIAQSCCAHGRDVMANVWMHNGFVQVEGRKMSKSEGNFVTIHDLLHTDMFGGRRWPGEVLRLAMLKTNYREPIDFTVAKLEEALREIERWERMAKDAAPADAPDPLFVAALADDLNLNEAFVRIHALMNEGQAGSALSSLHLLGIDPVRGDDRDADVSEVVQRRLDLIAAKNWTEADKIRDELLAQGIQLKDGKDPATGERITTWEVKR
jgi:cysteinyl-tRNA synthetase